jgi:hypothetical protein
MAAVECRERLRKMAVPPAMRMNSSRVSSLSGRSISAAASGLTATRRAPSSPLGVRDS